MDFVLSRSLPSELADRIARQVHELNFESVLESIEHRLVRIRAEGEFSWLISERQNYYHLLEDLSPYCSDVRRHSRRSGGGGGSDS